VCRSWQAAAAGCRRIRLLYCCGWRDAADEAFADWLRHRSPQLEALTLSGDSGEALEALADAAAAAADDSPLELHTLRVLGCYVDLPLAGRLVEGLPFLHTLQLCIKPQHLANVTMFDVERLVTKHLGPLQSAMMLEELYLGGPFITSSRRMRYASDVAELLPPNLKRLSWSTHSWPDSESAPSLAHLSQLSYLQMLGWDHKYSSVPPSVKELELYDSQGTSLEGLLQQREVLTGLNWRLWDLGYARMAGSVRGEEHLSSFTRIKTLDVNGDSLKYTPVRDAMASLGSLSTLKVHASHALPVLPAGGGAGRFSSLRNLDLRLQMVRELTGLSAATGITRLSVSMMRRSPGPEPKPSWGKEIGRLQGLRWLSVPAVLLEEGGAWLGGLQQLQVLVLDEYWYGSGNLCEAWLSSLDGGGSQLLPPRLQVVGVTLLYVWSMAPQQLRRRLRELLSSRGCEVVVGADLDQLADPTQQLAGLPLGLQQALACV
jgi:hypothetical protein